MTTELEGCVSDMCNISEVILERALEEGLEKGLEQGIEIKLMKKLSLTEEEAMDMLDIAEENRRRYQDILKK